MYSKVQRMFGRENYWFEKREMKPIAVRYYSFDFDPSSTERTVQGVVKKYKYYYSFVVNANEERSIDVIDG